MPDHHLVIQRSFWADDPMAPPPSPWTVWDEYPRANGTLTIPWFHDAPPNVGGAWQEVDDDFSLVETSLGVELRQPRKVQWRCIRVDAWWERTLPKAAMEVAPNAAFEDVRLWMRLGTRDLVQAVKEIPESDPWQLCTVAVPPWKWCTYVTNEWTEQGWIKARAAAGTPIPSGWEAIQAGILALTAPLQMNADEAVTASDRRMRSDARFLVLSEGDQWRVWRGVGGFAVEVGGRHSTRLAALTAGTTAIHRHRAQLPWPPDDNEPITVIEAPSPGSEAIDGRPQYQLHALG